MAGIGALPIAIRAAAAPVRSLPFGAAVQTRQILADRDFRDAVIRECDSITPEIEFKWDFIQSERDAINLTAADQLAAFALRNGKQVHGHALIWHRGIPAWAVQDIVERRDWSIVQRFLAMVLTRFAGIAKSWDVVNEPFGIGTREDGLRASPYLTAFGPDYIRRAFEEAHQFAPNATLYLNEYGLLYNYPESAAKRAAALRLLEHLKSSGVPIGGFGIQAHIEIARMDAFDRPAVANFLRRLTELGLAIRISELDVVEAETALPVAERDRRVGEAVRRLLEVVSESPALTGLTCWGLSDRYSWLPPQSETSGLNRGLPLDSDLGRKPMYRTVRDFLAKR